MTITLEELGYNPTFETYRTQKGLDASEVGRVIAEHRDRYIVKNGQGEYEAELLGNLRFTAESRNDLPAVGDWVAISLYDVGKAMIHAIFPRNTLLERQAVGKFGEKQIIATNIDVGLIVQSLNRDFSINRLERYLAICHSANISPMVVLTKIDLADKVFLEDLRSKISARLEFTPIFALSNLTGEGLPALKANIVAGKTYCLLGSSGVGKSSLINSLSGQTLMETGSISQSIDRGKHVTTHRELVPLVNGGLLIDNPGMREVGITDNPMGLENTFESIYELAKHCKFADCSHTSENGCAVLEAVENGEIEESALENFHKMERENAHFSATVQEKRQKDKRLGKMYREVKKHRKQHKF